MSERVGRQKDENINLRAALSQIASESLQGLENKYASVSRLFDDASLWVENPDKKGEFLVPTDNLGVLIVKRSKSGRSGISSALLSVYDEWEEEGNQPPRKLFGYGRNTFFTPEQTIDFLYFAQSYFKRKGNLTIAKQADQFAPVLKDVETDRVKDEEVFEISQVVNGHAPVESLARKNEKIDYSDGKGMFNQEEDDAVALYRKDTKNLRLLEALEEKYLFQVIERAEELSEFGRVSGLNGNLNPQEIIARGDLAKDLLTQMNARLSDSIAKKFIGRGLPYQDLVQEANYGLTKAIRKFDWRRGLKFSTFATWWVRQAASRAVADQGRTVRVPVNMSDEITKAYGVKRRMTQELGREPTMDELADELGISAKKAEKILNYGKAVASLDAPVGKDEDTELAHFLENKDAPDPLRTSQRNILYQKLREVVETLEPREARILRLRFGLGGGRAYTLEEVGEKHGLTRERIRQIEAKALRRLRHPKRARHIREYMD